MATRFIGKIGRDRFGQLAQEDLEREKVDAHFVETEAHLTGSVAVFVDHTGERSMVSGHGADFYLLPQELPRDDHPQLAAPAPHGLVVLHRPAAGRRPRSRAARASGRAQRCRSTRARSR